MRINISGIRMATAFLLIIVVPFAVLAEPKGTIYRDDGSTASGAIRYKPASQSYVVTTPPNNITQEIPKTKVRKIVAERPPEMKQAEGMMRSNPAGAIPMFEKIMKDYQEIDLDIVAAGYLARCYSALGQHEKTMQQCEKVLSSTPNAIMSMDFAMAYLDALIAKDEKQKFESVVKKIIGLGSREASAIACLKRGDMAMRSKSYKEANVDGYLRVILMYKDVKDLQPVALAGAMKCHEALNEIPFVEKWRSVLLTEYPDSPYAGQVKK